MFNKREIGNIEDVRCKKGIYSKINRKKCGNNCEYWINNKCYLGY